MNKLPNTRTNDIIEQNAGKELLIYDLLINKAYVLNETSKIVYQACGRLSFAQLKNEHQFSDELIYFALDEFRKNNLLENNYHSPLAGLSRREVVKRIGFASMLALPMITIFNAPTAAQATSPACLLENAVYFITNPNSDCANLSPQGCANVCALSRYRTSGCFDQDTGATCFCCR